MKEYVDTVGKTLFSQNELVEILTWDINDDLKISLLKMSKEPISIIGKGYSTAVCLHILSNNFAESDLPSLFSVNIVAIDVQLDGTAEAFSLSGKGKNPVHKNVKISVENVNRFPIKHVIVFNKYITPLLKYNEVQFVHCAYYGSDDAKKWPNKLAVLTDDEFEHNEQGIPKWFNINYEDVDGNEMYQTFELKDFDGTPYYSLESINDI